MPTATSGAILSGTKWRFSYSIDAGTTWTTLNKATSCSLNYTMQGEDIHHKDNTSKFAESQTESITGQMQIEGYAATGDNWETLLQAAIAGTIPLWRLETGDIGDLRIQQAARFSGVALTAAVRTSGKYSYPLVTVGGPTITTIAS